MATRWEMGGAPSREDGDDHHPRLRKSPHGCGRGAADVIASSGGRIMIGDIRAVPLATDIAGEQTLNIGKTDEIAESIMPSPGSEIPFVTSAHDDTRSGSRPNPRLRFYLSLRNIAPLIQNAEGHSDFFHRR